ncbi:MAG TPA: acyl-CoA dehydrogenase family protein, partial [Terriglobales bacterium]|nr:acyl-CoA dehydrogenase family protein [Terriglobales bacterium]
MDFGFSEEQEMLRASARELLAGECDMTYVRRMMDDNAGFSEDQWRKLAELGWLGLVLPEQHGGSGLDLIDLVVVLEEMGKVVMPGPFFPTVVLAGIAIELGGTAEQKQRYLPDIASGKLKATLAHLEQSARWDADGIQLEARQSAGGYTLNGTKLFVPDIHNAGLVVVAARTGGTGEAGVTLFLLDPKRDGAAVSLHQTLDQTRKLGALELSNVA